MTSKDALPIRVPFSATPPGETPQITQWAQRAVWTDRMLSTLLEDKVRGGKWHTLIDKVYAELNLYLAARKVTGKDGAAGVDGQTCEAFEEHLIVETRRLGEQLRGSTYRPAAVRRVQIPKPGRPNETRPLGIPTVRDRVVQKAVLNVIEPILDHQFHERSFGFRHGRGAHDALRIVEQKIQEGYVYVVDADLKGYFDSIPKDRLLKLIEEHISDSRMFKLIKMFLDQIYPRRESLAKLKARIKELTPRKRSGSMETIVQELNRVLIGWFGYFRHSRWTIFKDLDAKIRSRLRRLLLQRHRKNPKRLPRQQRWPNAYFTKVGLWSLRAAHHRFAQSHAGNY